MMKLSLMNKVVNTLTEDKSSPIAITIAKRWFTKLDTIKYKRASANFIFEISVDKRCYMLRFNSITEKETDSIKDEIAVLHYLAENGAEVCNPLPSLQGNFCETVDTKLGIFIAIMYEKINGVIYELNDMSDEQIRLWGAKLGDLHRLLQYIPEGIGSKRSSWKELMEFTRQYIGDDETYLLQEYELVYNQLQNMPITKQMYGLIHFDFETDNILWNDKNEIAIIDFDDMAKLPFRADIMFAVRGIFDNKPLDYHNVKFKLFLQGYQSRVPFDNEELDNFSIFSRLHRLFFIARLRRSLDIEDTANYPEWIGRLTTRIQQNYITGSINDIRTGKLIVR